MPATRTPIEQLSLTFRAEAPAAPRASLPGGWWFWCLLGIGIGIGGWLVSRHYLAERLGERLLSTHSRGEAVTAIEGLILLDSSSSHGIVVGLQHEDFYVARTAFRTIEAQITRWQQLKAGEFNLRIRRLAQSLNALPNSTPPDNLILASSLASRIFTLCLESDDVALRDVMELCEGVIQRAGKGQVRTLADIPPQQTISDMPTNSDQFTALASPPPPLPVDAADPSSELPGDIQLDTDRLTNEGDFTLQQPATVNTPSQVANSTGGARASLRLVTSPINTSLQLSADRSNAVPDVSDVQNEQQSTHLTDATDLQITQTLAGIDQLPIKELVRLLASVQPKISQAAVLALRRHGMSDNKLELAMQLATGTEQHRLKIIEQLASRTDLDPRVWLLWMAQDGQTAVRARAVAELNSMLDLDVMRELRQQLNRERDPQVAQLIRQVLMTP